MRGSQQQPDLSPPMDHHVRLLRRQYLQLVDPSALSFPADPLLSTPDFQRAVYSALFAPAALPLPPPERYTARVLKRLIALLSVSEQPAIHDGLLEAYTGLLSRPSSLLLPHPPDIARTHVTYTLPPSPFSHREIGPPITLLEARSVLAAQGTTGMRTWEAALALSEYLISAHLGWIYKGTGLDDSGGGRVLRETDSVLEIGAGTGLVALVAARLGARRVVATDGDAAVCEALEVNVHLNGAGDVVEVRRRVWAGGGEEEEEELGAGGFDLVLGADVIYDATTLPSLMHELKTHFTHNPRLQAIIAAPMRNQDTFAAFTQCCRECGFVLTESLWTPRVPRMFFYDGDPVRIVRVCAGGVGG